MTEDVKKAEADAIAYEKQKEAMAKIQQVAVIEMVVGKLPEIVKNVALPLANVDSITMYGEGNSAKMVTNTPVECDYDDEF